MHQSPPHSSEEADPLQLLRTAIAGGDWELARSAAALVAAESLPASPEGLKRHADALGEVLNAARAGRAHMVDSLARVRAATRFQAAGDSSDNDERQNLVDSTNF